MADATSQTVEWAPNISTAITALILFQIIITNNRKEIYMEFSKLTDYLYRQDDSVVVVTFHKIGEIIGLGDRLPKEYYEQVRKGFLDGEEISDEAIIVSYGDMYQKCL